MSIENYPCPHCSGFDLTEVSEYIEPDEQDPLLERYWWCLCCNWKSDFFVYPHTPDKPIEVDQQSYKELQQLLREIADEHPTNRKMRSALRMLQVIENNQ